MGDVYTNPPQSRNEAILRATIDGTEYTAPPQSRIEDLLLELKEAIEQGGTGEGDMKKSIYDSDNSVATAGGIKMFVNQKIGTLPQRVGSLETTAGVLEGEVASIEDTLDNLGTASTKNSTSVVTQSTDLVESGAVYDAIESAYQLTKDSVGWSGKNKYNATVETITADGITITRNEFGEYVVTGKATALHQFSLGVNMIKAGDYILNGCPSGGSLSTYDIRFTNNFIDFGQGVELHLDNDTVERILITVRNGYEFPSGGLVFRPMIRRADIVDDIYEPYHASVSDSLEEKADNSVIAPTENGTTASQAYAVGSHAIRNGKFITWKNAKAQGETINDASDYTSGDVADELVTITSACTNIITGATANTNVIKKYGNVVYLTLALSGVSVTAWSEAIAIIPSDYRPKEDRIIANCVADGNPCASIIYNSNGNIKIGTSISDKTIYITGAWIL